jgi:hypothetical protein
MQGKNSSKAWVSEGLEVGYTTKPVSGWGGLVVVYRFFEQLHLREWLREVLPDGRTSPNQIPVVDIVWSLFATVLTGGRRFAHVERLRGDEVVSGVLGVRRIPSAMTLTRYFRGFVRRQVEELSEGLWRLCWPHLASSPLGEVLDLDSTVFERYGHQEGSRKGHNPRKPGRPCHRPLLAMLATSKLILHGWLRSGNTGSSEGSEAFLTEALARLPEDYRLYGVRADNGFFTTGVLNALEDNELPYVIAVKMNRRIRRRIAGIDNWRALEPGLEVGEGTYQAHGWSVPRRLVVVRHELRERPQASGRKLFDLPGFSFHAYVTSLPHPPQEVWRFYNARGDCENRFKELKHDFGADGFCLQTFDGTESVFRLICFLFNLLELFRQQVLAATSERLVTLRHKYLVVGGILGARGRRTVLRLGLRGPWKRRFQVLLARLRGLRCPTVAQLTQLCHTAPLPPPSPWRPRPPRGPHRPLNRFWLPFN